MSGVSGPFIVRPIATSLFMIALFLSGVLAYRLLPVASLPQVDYPTIEVSTFYPGASPEVMTSAVTAPLERQLGQMAGLNEMTSTSSSGSSVITLQFTLDLSLDVAEQEVQEAINVASTYLPSDLPNPPVYNKVNPADVPVMTLALTSNTLPLSAVEDIADTRLSEQIAQLSGVGLVAISGGQRPAVRVKTNPDALAAYGLTQEDVRSAIVTGNVNAPKGSFDGPKLSYLINANDQLLSSTDYKPLIIAYNNNAPVRLSDVAEVSDGVENNKLAAWENTMPAVILSVQRQPGANVIAVVNRIQALLPQLRTTLPAGLHMDILNDRTITIRASIDNVQSELLLAVILVVLVVFIFLRSATATIIPAIVVPLSLISTLGVMYLCGFSLNNLTLMALTISTGFVADDTIVMIENITRHAEEGLSTFEAAIQGSKQIAFTIISLTVALLGVLIPLLFMTDVVGRLFREFAVTLAVTISISAFISLTLTPMLCAHLLGNYQADLRTKFAHTTKMLLDNVIAHYDASLQWVLNRQRLILAIAAINLILTGILFYVMPKGFFPQQDIGLIQGITVAPGAVSFSAMAQRQQALAKIIAQDPAVDKLASFVGIDGVNTSLNNGRMLISLKPLAMRKVSASKVIARLQPKLAKITGIQSYLQPTQDFTVDVHTSRSQYQYSLSAPKAAEVVKWSERMLIAMRQLPILKDVTSDQQNLGLRTIINIDRDTASRLGITAQMIDDTLYDAFGQRQVSIMFTQSNQYRVVQDILPGLTLTPDGLKNLYINSASNGAVPFSTFTTITQSMGPLVVTREGQFPAVTLSFNLAPGVALGDAVRAINKIQQQIGLPPNIAAQFEGAAKIFANALGNEAWLLLAAILVVYIVLGMLYESYIHPLTILSTLPSAGLGALIALHFTTNLLSVIALIGIILLIGIVMKNAIMMIDFALEQERTHKKPPFEAIHQACLLRFRPILMTTLAALLGAVPLALGTGIGSELRTPLGIAIMGGLIVSQLLTLYTTPVIYLALSRWHSNVEVSV